MDNDDDATPLMNDGGRMTGIIISVIKNGSGRNTREYIGGGGADRDNIIHNTLLGVSIPTTALPVISLQQGNRTGRDV